MGWPGAGRAAWLAVVATLAVTAQLQVWLASSSEATGGRPLEALFAAVCTVPLLFRGPALLLLLVTLGGATGAYLIGSELGQPWFATLLAVYALGARAGTTSAVVGLGAVTAGVLAVDLPRLQDGARAEDVLPAWFVTAATFGFGRWMRNRRREQGSLRERAERAERDRAEATREAVAAERALIARELHDLVGHSLAVIVLQAQAAGRVLGSDPDQAKKAVDAVADLGREGLEELRRLLGVLVATEDEELPALPSLGNLDALVARFDGAGLPVQLELHGERRPLPPGLDLSAYRIVQEALTNTLKHAAPTRACVDVRFSAAELEILVRDEGSGRRPQDGDGHVGRGLIGMRERVALYGGELAAAAHPAGGFEVRARFPLEASR